MIERPEDGFHPSNWFFIFAIVLLTIAFIASALSARAHDSHLALTLEQEKVYNFYAGWLRPKGNFSGVQHRKASCCNRTDCFPVTEIRMDANGIYRIKIDAPSRWVDQWYTVNPSIIESNQEDPRETPDGRSHACIIGGQVVCFVEGNGI